jgi:hypothetical protein
MGCQRWLTSAVLLTAALHAGALPAVAQVRAVPTIVLDRGAKEFDDPFSQLAGLIELRDGRVVVVDVKEKLLNVVDFAAGTSTPVSRIGSGPLEYMVPGNLFGSVRDSVIYFDMTQRRMLVLSASGKAVRTMPYADAKDPLALLRLAIPTAGDTLGHLFGQTLGMTMPKPGGEMTSLMPKFADTVDIMRMDRGTAGATAMTRIRNPVSRSQPKMEMSGTAVKFTITAPDFRANDAWTALPDGRVAVLRDGVYRVHIITAGRPETLGAPIAFTALPVTVAERTAMVDSLKKMATAMLKSGADGEAGVKFDFQVIEPQAWATVKPAYVNLMSSPDGRLWVGLSTATGAPGRMDVLDGAGALLAHVQFAPGEHAVGWGRGTVYTVRTDQDDLQYLRRYTLPALR